MQRHIIQPEYGLVDKVLSRLYIAVNHSRGSEETDRHAIDGHTR